MRAIIEWCHDVQSLNYSKTINNDSQKPQLKLSFFPQYLKHLLIHFFLIASDKVYVGIIFPNISITRWTKVLFILQTDHWKSSYTATTNREAKKLNKRNYRKTGLFGTLYIYLLFWTKGDLQTKLVTSINGNIFWNI